MFRLTREVRFAVNPTPSLGGANGLGGIPPLAAMGRYCALRITLTGPLDRDSSYLRNIKDIDLAVRERAIAILRDRVDAPALFDRLKDAWPGASLDRMELCLTPCLSLIQLASEHPAMTRISQMFEFSASHRLHNPALSDEANRACFGKCNNPQGHGHNYQVQVTLAGTPGVDGLLAQLPELERIVGEVAIEKLDHKNLNLEVPEFGSLNPTVENIARVIHGWLRPYLSSPTAKLAAVTVWETPKTWCEYSE